jgi:hypothetical protein
VAAASCIALGATLLGPLLAPRADVVRAQAADPVPEASPARPDGDGATLRIETTPRDALFRIDDGDAWTNVPADAGATIPLAAGRHTVRLKRRGYMNREETIRLGAGEGRTLIVPLSAKTRGGAVLRSALFPGLGSRYMERPALARILAATAAVSAAGAIVWDNEMSDRVDEYDAKRAAYEAAVTPEEIDAARQEAEAAFDDAESAHDARNAFLIALAGAYAVSIGEALFFYPFHGPGETTVERSAGGALGGGASFRVVLARVPLARAAP